MTMGRNIPLAISVLLMILEVRGILCQDDNCLGSIQDVESQDGHEVPSVLVVLLARNKELNLPYSLTLFERQNYPKKRMLLHIRADRCHDRTIDILEDWLGVNQNLYLFVDAVFDRSQDNRSNASEGYQLTDDIVAHIVDLKQEALANAKRLLVDYVLFLDADVYLTNPDVINNLIAENQTVVAPALDSVISYSNFWDSMSNDFLSEPSRFYHEIIHREIKGCFEIPIVNSCFLINMMAKSIDKISFDPMDARFVDSPIDDIITFGTSVKRAGLSSFICNKVRSGYVEHPLIDNDTPYVIQKRFKELRLMMARYEPIPTLTTVSPPLAMYLQPPPTVRDKAGLSEIYYINLARRPNRKARMEFMLSELGLEGRRVNAVDGWNLNQSYLDAMGIKVLRGYADPFENRETLTMGEVGCFLSHYQIWKDVIKKGHTSVMILEDDVHFDLFFKEELITAEIQLVRSERHWDLVYLGRKGLVVEEEWPVSGMKNFVHPSLSYWLVGYLLSLSGARKLVQAEPLGKMLPADEFVPLMYNKPHRTSWTLAYPVRNLIAYAMSPSIVEPQHYNHEPVYISDTEGVEGKRFVNGTDTAEIPVAPVTTDTTDIPVAPVTTDITDIHVALVITDNVDNGEVEDETDVVSSTEESDSSSGPNNTEGQNCSHCNNDWENCSCCNNV